MVDVVKMLIAAGADVNVKKDVPDIDFCFPKENIKMTALDLAHLYKEKEIAKLLKQAGGKSFWYGPVGYVLRVFSRLFFWAIFIGIFAGIIFIVVRLYYAIFD